MKKILLLILFTIISCDSNSYFGGDGFGGTESCGLEYFVFLNSSDNCDEESIRIQIYRNEYDRLNTIRMDGEGFCIAVTVNPLDGSDSSQGWINTDKVKAFELIPITC